MTVNHRIDFHVPFHDLDPMMVVWHGNYYKYFDRARFSLFEAAGIDLYRYMLDHQLVFPITKTSAKHIQPLRYNDKARCEAVVVEAHNKIVMNFEIRRYPTQELCTRGTSEQLAVKLPDMELEFEIPADIRKALGFE